jgi:hypothetical protein
MISALRHVPRRGHSPPPRPPLYRARGEGSLEKSKTKAKNKKMKEVGFLGSFRKKMSLSFVFSETKWA